MNRIVISGTPRISSMKAMQSMRTIGISERRPEREQDAERQRATMPDPAMTSVRNRPPQSGVSTTRSPNAPPWNR